MGELCEGQNIVVIRGDVLEVYFEIDGISPNVVRQVCFKSDAAQIYVELPYSKLREAYCLRLESEYTNMLKPTIGSYDLTVEFIDGNIITVAHEREFIVLKKRNSQNEEE